jgi:hypothetical protein
MCPHRTRRTARHVVVSFGHGLARGHVTRRMRLAHRLNGKRRTASTRHRSTPSIGDAQWQSAPPSNPVPQRSLLKRCPRSSVIYKRNWRPLIKAVPVKAANNKAAENEWKTVKAFKKTYGTVTPHVDVLTFNKWVAQGLRPMEGEHATKVGALRLFHKSQTRPLTKEEAGEFAKKFAERAAADKAKIVSITEAGAQQ